LGGRLTVVAFDRDTISLHSICAETAADEMDNSQFVSAPQDMATGMCFPLCYKTF